MIGIGDIKEHECVKYKDINKERRSYSAKAKCNSWKNLSLMDYTGRFIFVHVLMASNDREALTNSPIYLEAGEYFSPGEWASTDGGFEGDGPIRYSFKNIGGSPERQSYNLAYKEVRMGIENAFGRVGMWFPLLGNNKKRLNYSDNVIKYAIHAASRLHNWILNTENLSYSANTSAEVFFRSYY